MQSYSYFNHLHSFLCQIHMHLLIDYLDGPIKYFSFWWSFFRILSFFYPSSLWPFATHETMANNYTVCRNGSLWQPDDLERYTSRFRASTRAIHTKLASNMGDVQVKEDKQIQVHLFLLFYLKVHTRITCIR